MFEMSLVLGTCVILIVVAYEFNSVYTREWGENSRSFF